MAIIPTALRTIPSMRRVSTIRPALPGGRFPGVALAVLGLVSSASNGSRFATGFSSPGFAASGDLAAFADAASCRPLRLAWPKPSPVSMPQAPLPVPLPELSLWAAPASLPWVAEQPVAEPPRKPDWSVARGQRLAEHSDGLAQKHKPQGPPIRPAATEFAMILRVA